MAELFGGIFVAFILILIVFLNLLMLRMLFFRLKGYLLEILSFLEKNNYKYINSTIIQEQEWMKNPFKDKATSFLLISLPLFPYKQHKKITAENVDTGEIKFFWMRVSTPFFGKNKIEFMEE